MKTNILNRKIIMRYISIFTWIALIISLIFLPIFIYILNDQLRWTTYPSIQEKINYSLTHFSNWNILKFFVPLWTVILFSFLLYFISLKIVHKNNSLNSLLVIRNVDFINPKLSKRNDLIIASIMLFLMNLVIIAFASLILPFTLYIHTAVTIPFFVLMLIHVFLNMLNFIAIIKERN
ncbi:hypothetical protein VBM87_00490 [Mycoplasma sp. 744]|uniref:hypothetical protein n=1 Tax=unclassified Mycoplasma TaxID=2683645 RepID=UPI00211B768E|nr:MULTISPECIES: hypothetical protein [unclassified Mycoplasma]MEA4115267.1 hypothetical protein [Mycoplasma sp. 744]UUM19271.1 hypothetical protein NPA14_00090 [Mycoplasma sp. 1018B]